jgi:hypothetical protein
MFGDSYADGGSKKMEAFCMKVVSERERIGASVLFVDGQVWLKSPRKVTCIVAMHMTRTSLLTYI